LAGHRRHLQTNSTITSRLRTAGRFESEFTGDAANRRQVWQLNVLDSLWNVHLFNGRHSSCRGSSNASLQDITQPINYSHSSCNHYKTQT